MLLCCVVLTCSLVVWSRNSLISLMEFCAHSLHRLPNFTWWNESNQCRTADLLLCIKNILALCVVYVVPFCAPAVAKFDAIEKKMSTITVSVVS